MFDPITCQIAGVKYRDVAAQAACFDVAPGTELSLRLEPDNAFDPHATQVRFGDHHLGYVPAVWSALVASALRRDASRVKCVTINGNTQRLQLHIHWEA